MIKKSFIILCSIFAIGLFGNLNSSHAVGHLDACTLAVAGSASGTGLDGSNCDSGFMCDRGMKVCINTFEVPCRLKGCSVGMVCLDDSGNLVASSSVGTCQTKGGSSTEDNAISETLCNMYSFVTGKSGRIVIGIIFVGTGGTFIMGRVNIGTVVAVGLGAGCIFGASAIVSVFVGRGFAC